MNTIHQTWLKRQIDSEKSILFTLARLHKWVVTEASNTKGHQVDLFDSLTRRAEWYERLIKNHQANLTQLEANLAHLEKVSFAREVYNSVLGYLRSRKKIDPPK